MGYLIGCIIWGVIWGCATNAVVHNRGYEDENWFWWGFFFGFIALIVAFSKPQVHSNSSCGSINTYEQTSMPGSTSNGKTNLLGNGEAIREFKVCPGCGEAQPAINPHCVNCGRRLY